MKPSEISLFLGPVGLPEIIMILLVLALLAVPIVLALILAGTFSKPKPPQIPDPPVSPPTLPENGREGNP